MYTITITDSNNIPEHGSFRTGDSLNAAIRYLLKHDVPFTFKSTGPQSVDFDEVCDEFTSIMIEEN